VVFDLIMAFAGSTRKFDRLVQRNRSRLRISPYLTLQSRSVICASHYRIHALQIASDRRRVFG
jgi:hypothetical protein